ncbi:Uncharacterized protein Fot_37250 [Forsythia ovata]|uniref:Uncharacterized protein n=1 Tax=Forsythia ovata TaxID=205694 RepID=A0ABD1SRQ8_9LAMI
MARYYDVTNGGSATSEGEGRDSNKQANYSFSRIKSFGFVFRLIASHLNSKSVFAPNNLSSNSSSDCASTKKSTSIDVTAVTHPKARRKIAIAIANGIRETHK